MPLGYSIMEVLYLTGYSLAWVTQFNCHKDFSVDKLFSLVKQFCSKFFSVCVSTDWVQMTVKNSLDSSISSNYWRLAQVQYKCH